MSQINEETKETTSKQNEFEQNSEQNTQEQPQEKPSENQSSSQNKNHILGKRKNRDDDNDNDNDVMNVDKNDNNTNDPNNDNSREQNDNDNNNNSNNDTNQNNNARFISWDDTKIETLLAKDITQLLRNRQGTKSGSKEDKIKYLKENHTVVIDYTQLTKAALQTELRLQGLNDEASNKEILLGRLNGELIEEPPKKKPHLSSRRTRIQKKDEVYVSIYQPENYNNSTKQDDSKEQNKSSNGDNNNENITNTNTDINITDTNTTNDNNNNNNNNNN